MPLDNTGNGAAQDDAANAPDQQAPAAATFQSKIDTARNAGYGDHEIVSYLNQSKSFAPKLEAARQAGYSESDIFGHLGLKPNLPEPKAEVASMDPNGIDMTAGSGAGPALGRIAGAVTQGAIEGFGGNPVGSVLSDKAQEKLDQIQQQGGWKGTAAQLASTLGTDVGTAGNVIAGLGNAAVGAYQHGVSQAGEEVGAPQLGRDLAALPEAFPQESMGMKGVLNRHPHLPGTPEAIQQDVANARQDVQAMKQRVEPTLGPSVRTAEPGPEAAAIPPSMTNQTPAAPTKGLITPEPQPLITPEQRALQEEREAAVTTQAQPSPNQVTQGVPESAPPPVTSPTPAVRNPASDFVMMSPDQLKIDPARFQFKASDDRGVTGALQGVQKWEPALANPITAWESADGDTFVVNGHQRHDLASRAAEAGQPDVQMPTRVFRENDGYTPEFMRTLGAYQNIAEGTGTPVDAAKVMRGQNAIPAEMVLPELPPKGQMVIQARSLSRLSPNAFGMVENGVVPPAYAAHVGDLIADPHQQEAALGLLTKADPANSNQARMMVQDIRNSGFLQGTQQGLFGTEDFAKSIFPERMQVLDGAMGTLRRNRGVFKAAVEGEDELRAAGNQLSTDANVKARATNDQILDRLQRDATTRGPISDALTDAANDIATGKPKAGVQSAFLAKVRGIIDRGEDAGVQPGDLHGGEGHETAPGITQNPEPDHPITQTATPQADLLGDNIPEMKVRPGAEPTVKNDPNQATMPGMEPSAVQAQAARDAEGRGALQSDVPQKPANEGLFERPAADQGGLPLYSFPGMLFDPAAWKKLFGITATPAQIQAVELLRDKTGLQRAVAEVKAWLSPTSLRGAGGQEALMRKFGAEKAQSYAQSMANLEKVRNAIDVLPSALQDEFTHRMETGQGQMTPELDQVADAIRKELDNWASKIQSLGKGYLSAAIDDYMGHVWANYPEWKAAQNGLLTNPQTTLTTKQIQDRIQAQAMSKTPLLGSGNFLKQRTFPTMRDGMTAGLQPLTHNPIDMQLIKMREMQKFYHGDRLADTMKSSGMATWVPAGGERMAEGEGYVKLDDKVFQPRLMGQSNPAGFGRLEPGNYYAPEPAARLFNRYMQTSLVNQSHIINGIRQLGNGLNMLQLGLSFFHATFVAMDTIKSNVALAMRQMGRGIGTADAGTFGKGAFNFATGIVPGANLYHLVDTVNAGRKLNNAWLDPANASPEWQRLAKMLNEGGGRGSMDRYFGASAEGPLVKHASDLLNPKVILGRVMQSFADEPSVVKKAAVVPMQLAGRVIESLSHPLMGWLVPRAKMGTFAKMAQDWQEGHMNATPEERSAAMIKAWDSVENRLGLMTYDNLFWNKTQKDIAFLMTRSVGWNVGTIRELGGAGVDTVKAVSNIAQGRAPEFTHRMAYPIAMAAVTAGYGALINYLSTGETPQSTMDYFFPRTGKMTPQGKPERRNIPGYEKDVIEYSQAPGQTLLNKINPLPEMGMELYNNKDYYGGIIRDPQRDPAAPAYMDYLFNQAMPFSWRGYERLQAEKSSRADQALAFFGFQPASKSISQPEVGKQFQQKENVKEYKRRAREQGRMTPFGSAYQYLSGH